MNRRACHLAVAASLLAVSAACGQGPGPRLTSAIIDSTGARLGEVTASEDAGGTILQIHVTGLRPGLHGMHLHAGAKCEPPTFQSAQGHFNPTGRKHGSENPEGPHVGDLPNLEAGADGRARAVQRVEGWSLRAGAQSLGAPGVALIIHADPDDLTTDPTGNSGARVACALISVIASE